MTVAVVQVVTLLVGGSMALNGQVNPEQLTTFVLYVEFVTAASLSVCDQWGPLMEAIGASERVMYYLDRPPAPQIAAGCKLPSWSGKVHLWFSPCFMNCKFLVLLDQNYYQVFKFERIVCTDCSLSVLQHC